MVSAMPNPDLKRFGTLSQQVQYHKVQNEEVDYMCKAVEEYAATKKAEGKIEKAVEVINNMLKENIPLETALKCAKLDKATYDKYSADILREQ